jgi:hypothetical protein
MTRTVFMKVRGAPVHGEVRVTWDIAHPPRYSVISMYLGQRGAPNAGVGACGGRDGYIRGAGYGIVSRGHSVRRGAPLAWRSHSWLAGLAHKCGGSIFGWPRRRINVHFLKHDGDDRLVLQRGGRERQRRRRKGIGRERG